MIQFRYKEIVVHIIIIDVLFYSSDFFQVCTSSDCFLPGGEPGICRNIYRCKPLFNLLIKSKSRPSPLLLDYLRQALCGFEGKISVVCCPLLYDSQKSGRPNSLQENKPSSENSFHKSCGSVQTTDKVTGGNVAALYEFPWMALIAYETWQGVKYLCGGTLITSRYVLTAAHCVTDLKDKYLTHVRLGEHNLETIKDCEDGKGCAPPVRDIDIEEVIPHPDFSRPKLVNDIALVKLAEDVDFNECKSLNERTINAVGKSNNLKNDAISVSSLMPTAFAIRPICLPFDKELRKINLTQGEAVVTGWGSTESGTTSTVLLKAALPIIPRAICSKAYGKKIFIIESQICAGGKDGRDSCSGDSGGPLQYLTVNSLGDPSYVQIGIVSYGLRHCGAKGIPGVYTKVVNFVDWILQKLKK